MLGLGAWAFLAPASFARFIAYPPPYNRHLLHDAGAFQLGIGTATLLALRWSDALLVALTGFAVASGLHTLSHAIDRHLGGHAGDVPALGLLTLVAVYVMAGGSAGRWHVRRSDDAAVAAEDAGRRRRADGDAGDRGAAGGLHVAAARGTWLPLALPGAGHLTVRRHPVARFHYTRTGRGPPVVLLPGGTLWTYTYREVIPEFAKHFTVVAVDLPGQGYTTLKWHDFGYNLEAMSGALASFMDAVGRPAAHRGNRQPAGRRRGPRHQAVPHPVVHPRLRLPRPRQRRPHRASPVRPACGRPVRPARGGHALHRATGVHRPEGIALGYGLLYGADAERVRALLARRRLPVARGGLLAWRLCCVSL
jgi:hypothetical protein